jgi:hypothetical protein
VRRLEERRAPARVCAQRRVPQRRGARRAGQDEVRGALQQRVGKLLKTKLPENHYTCNQKGIYHTEAAQLAAIAARLRTATAVRSPGKRWSAVRQARIELVAAFLTSRKRAATLQPLLSSVEGIEERAAESCGLCSCEIDLAALESARMRVEKLAAAQTRRVEVHSRMARSQSKMEVVDPERAALFRKATGGKGGGMVDAAAAAAASRFAGARQRLLKLQTSRAEADAVADAAAKRRAERQLYIY